ncbi:MAG: hypothetical protein RLZZ15_2185 [Verrucomicrobiota bacterium]|jgi:hypothetical protein
MSPASASAPRLSVQEATDPEFWRTLRPDLTVGGDATVPDAAVADTGALLGQLRREGYFNARDVIDAGLVARLRGGIEALEARGIPPVFAFVYDEFWLVFRSLDSWLRETLGADYRALPDCWAWYVRPTDESAGWRPHRDRPHAALDAGHAPPSLTVWLPLTDATPLNGCIYIVPAPWDEAIHDPVAAEPKEFSLTGAALQNVRALPATAGSLLAWNQRLLHWGGRASARAAGPRCSIALQFQRGDVAPLATPLLDPRALLPFRSRLGLIGRVIRGYAFFQTADDPALKALAAALDWSYWHRAHEPAGAAAPPR